MSGKDNDHKSINVKGSKMEELADYISPTTNERNIKKPFETKEFEIFDIAKSETDIMFIKYSLSNHFLFKDMPEQTL